MHSFQFFPFPHLVLLSPLFPSTTYFSPSFYDWFTDSFLPLLLLQTLPLHVLSSTLLQFIFLFYPNLFQPNQPLPLFILFFPVLKLISLFFYFLPYFNMTQMTQSLSTSFLPLLDTPSLFPHSSFILIKILTWYAIYCILYIPPLQKVTPLPFLDLILTFVIFFLCQLFYAGHQNVIISQKFCQQEATNAVPKTTLLLRVYKTHRSSQWKFISTYTDCTFLST